MIKAITFDLDGVYFPSSGKKGFEKSLKDMGIPEEKVIHTLYKSDEMRDLSLGKLPREDFWNWFREYCEVGLSNGELEDLWVVSYEVNQDVREVLLKVRGNGYKTCVVSNNNPIRVSKLNEKFGFLGDFDVAVFSYEVGVFKPSKEIFEELIRKAEVKAEDVVYSDDNPDRLQGARDLGINAFLYTDFDSFVMKLKELGVNLS